LELDGYCEELKLAFEHQGPHHYGLDIFSDTDERGKRLHRVRFNDEAKVRLCDENGVRLIAIPEIPSKLRLPKVKAFIQEECSRMGIRLPRGFKTRAVDLKRAYAVPENRRELQQLQSIAQAKGGECLSENYQGSAHKLLWRCASGHNWWAMPGGIKQGQWCPYCRGYYRTIDDMKEMAATRGGEFLSSSFNGMAKKHLWKCAQGHQWETIPMLIKNGSWCPKCAGTARLSIEDMRRMAAERGGQCLSKRYVNGRTKLLWRCGVGHEWYAVSESIRFSGTWCPMCSAKSRGERQTG